VALRPGDGLVVFSDGVTEALDAEGHQFGTRGVNAVLAGGMFPPREVGERLLQEVRKHAQGCSQHDDITLVCFGRTGV
jgi:sigma-B regulation protein RsbU (phosphoserine phosphatase)